jgi:hypothetical protein
VLKIGALIRVTARKVGIALAGGYPYQEVWASIWAQLQQVRSTYTMAEKIRRAGIAFLPPAGFRLYFRSFDRCRTGISGSIFSQDWSETSQDFICGILGRNPALTCSRFQQLFRDKL